MKRLLLSLVLLLAAFGGARSQDSKENTDFKLAVNLYNDKLYDLALEQFRQFVNLYPNTQQGMEARYYLGLTQTKLGRFEDARVSFQNFALSYPEHPRAPEAWMNTAEAFVSQKNDREAALAFERVKTFHPRSKFVAAALLRASDLYERIGDAENARRVLRTLTQEYNTPEVMPARLKLAELQIAGKEFEPARQECRRVADATKDGSLRSRALVLMAEAYIGLDRTTEAENTLQSVVREYRAGESVLRAQVLLGELRSADGNFDEASAAWKAVADDSARAPRQLRQDALMRWALAEAQAGNAVEARRLYVRAAAVQARRSGEALFLAGRSAEQSGDRSGAAGYILQASADSSFSGDRRALLAAAFRSAVWAKQLQRVYVLADRFAADDPHDRLTPRIIYEAGRAALDQRDLRRADTYAEQVLTRFVASEWADDAALLQADVRRSQGNFAEAAEDYASLGTRFPASPLIPEARKLEELVLSYERTNRDAGLQKLAALAGDMIVQRSRGTLAYRLAEIAFDELKDYRLAADQYESALSSDLEESLRPSAAYRRARSLELLRNHPNSAIAKPAAAEVLSAYDSLVLQYGNVSLAADGREAAFLFRLRSNSSDSMYAAMMNAAGAVSGSVKDQVRFWNSVASIARDRNDLQRERSALRRAAGAASDDAQWAESMRGLAESYLRSGRADSAAAVSRELIKRLPGHPSAIAARMIAAEYESTAGATDRALELYAEAERLSSADDIRQVILRGRAFALLNGRRFREAQHTFEEVVRTAEEDVYDVDAERSVTPLRYLAAACADSAGDRAAARRGYIAFLQRDRLSSDASRAYYGLASIARAENDVPRAGRYLREASAIAARTGISTGDVAVETAELLFQNERYAEAVPLFSQVVEKSKSDSIRRFASARIVSSYFRVDNIPEADRRAALFGKTYPKAYNEAAEFEFERGRYQLRQNQMDRARQRFRSLAAQYPKAPIVPEAMYWLARSLELDQNFPAAVALYDSLLKAFPADRMAPRIMLALGNAYYAIEQWEKAAAQFRTILDHEERSPDLVRYAMNNLIMTYKEMEMFDGAMDLTRKYIERFPNDSDLVDKRIDIGVLYQKLGYFDQSIVHLQSLLESATPELEAELRYYIGEAYFYKADFQQAILEFLKVPYLVARKGKIDWVSTSYYMAGQSYEKMGKYDQAMTMYRQIVERKDTDVQFKTAAQKEIDRVKRMGK